MRGKITTVPLPSFYCPQGLIPHNIWVSNKIKDIPCHHYQHSAVWTYFITSAFVSFGIHVFGPVSHVFPVNYIHVHCVGQWDIVCLHVNTGGGGLSMRVCISVCYCMYLRASTCDLFLNNYITFLLSALSHFPSQGQISIRCLVTALSISKQPQHQASYLTTGHTSRMYRIDRPLLSECVSQALTRSTHH